MKSFFSKLILIIIVLLPAPAAAQNIQVSVNPAAGTVESNFQLSIAISDTPTESIILAEFDDSRLFTFERLAQGSNESLVNNKVQRTLTLVYLVKPKHGLSPGKYRLPDGRIKIADTSHEFKGPFFTIIPTKGPSAKTDTNQDVAFIQSVSNYQPYVGEQITYRSEIAADARFKGGSLDDFELSNFWRERITTDKPITRVVGKTTIHSFVEVLIPTKAGELLIPKRSLNAEMATRTRSTRRRGLGYDPLFSGLFSMRNRTRTLRLDAEELRLNVKALPPPPSSHDGRYIPVGEISMKTSVDATSIAAGESVVYSIEVDGSANLRPLKLKEENSSTYKRYDEEPTVNTRIDRDKLRFRKVFSTVLIPSVTGRFNLPEFSILYFDTKSKSYKTASAPPLAIEVKDTGKQDKLIKSGATPITGNFTIEGKSTTEQLDTKEKQQIEILANDLRPQRLSQKVLSEEWKLPSYLIAPLLFLIPLLSIGSYFYLRKQLAYHSNTAEKNFEQALPSALRQLDEFEKNAPSCDELRYCMRRYLSARLGTATDSLTNTELRETLENKELEPTVVEQMLQFEASLESRIYSGEKSGAGDESVHTLREILERFNNTSQDI